MDIANLLLTEPVLSPTPLEIGGTGFQPVKMSHQSSIENRESKEQAAKDFESVLLNKLLEEMKNTIGDWGFDKDGASQQVQGIFWLNMARDIANKGGLGLWKDVYEFLTKAESVTSGTK